MKTAVKRMIGSVSVGLSLSVVGMWAQTTPPPIPTYTISTVAGSYSATDSSNFAPVLMPMAILVDKTGNVYFTDTLGNRVQKIDAVSGAISTIAGTGTFGYGAGAAIGDGGPATKALLTQPSGLAFDAAGNLYIADSFIGAIRKVDTNGVITAFAGTENAAGFIDAGPVNVARIRNPQLLATDPQGNLYIADKENNRIRKVDTSGIVRTIAGNGGNSTTTGGGFSGDGGPAVLARLGQPQGVAVDHFGNIYIADTANNRIRLLAYTDSNGNPLTSGGKAFSDSTRVITTVVGGGASSGAVAPLAATLSGPRGLAIDANNNLYIADTGNNRILLLTTCLPPPAGATSSCVSNLTQVFANTTPSLVNPQAIALDASGNLYVAEGTANRIRKINAADSSSVILDGLQGGVVSAPHGLAVDTSGDVYVADTVNQRILKISGVAATPPGTVASAYGITQVAGLTGSSGLAGANPSLTGKPPAWGPDLSVTAAFSKISLPWGGAFDSSGNYYFADRGNHRVRKIDINGNMTTVAGTGYPVTTTSLTATNKTQTLASVLNNGYFGDGGLAIAAQLNAPSAVAVDSTNNLLYIADTNNHVIRQVNLTTGFIKTYVGIAPACSSTLPTTTAAAAGTTVLGTSTNPTCSGVSGASGDGLLATDAQLNTPEGVAVDAAGNLYIGDSGNYAIREVNYSSGIITTIAGLIGGEGRGGDNIAATTSTNDSPVSVAVDGSGNVIWAEGCLTSNATGQCATQRVRRLDVASGFVTTLTSGSTTGTLQGGTLGGDGGPSTKAGVIVPLAVAVDGAGNVFIADSTNRIRKLTPVTATK